MTVPRAERLRVIEIYASVQGESTHVGRPCVFVRLAGCDLRCTWCDSTFTFTGGEHRSIDDVVAEVCALGIDLVEVTGGEPLVHRQAIPLMERLLAAGKEVLLETAGSRDISVVPRGVTTIMDLKPPGSGETEKMRWENLSVLRDGDEVKFVLSSREDYLWSRDVIGRHGLGERGPVLLSPVHGMVDPAELTRWILEDRLQVRLQIQLHKVVWPPDERGV